MQSVSTQWNQQLSRYVLSKLIKFLEQNIRKQINCKRPSSTKQINRKQNIGITICKKKHNQVGLAVAVFTSTKLVLNYITQARCN